ncbi:hypothetical protein QQF64_023768 [Cirrhinus molitorella]|uniref:Uncharacterized protein n=1 Tax=Cirrhinus molitorella TaxID=172907 RepID=A0ABR3NJB2_9TELE
MALKGQRATIFSRITFWKMQKRCLVCIQRMAITEVFFHCNIERRCLTYFNSLGETEWQCQSIAQHWCAFAATRGVKGDWDLKTTEHSLQTDSVSCGIHTLAIEAKNVEFVPKLFQEEKKQHVPVGQCCM